MGRARNRRVVVEHEEGEDELSSEEDVASVEEEEEEEEEEAGEEEEDDEDDAEVAEAEALQEHTSRSGVSGAGVKTARIKIPLKKGLILCKVCKETDHQAGFVGSVYVDCPNRPCFLCKQPGHTTLTCPYRSMIRGHGGAPATPPASERRQSRGFLDVAHRRHTNGRPKVKKLPPIPSKIDSAILKLHSRRVTTLEFHPTKDNVLLSGDKKGQLAVWDFEKVFERTVLDTVHHCLVNSIKFLTRNDVVAFTASSDGTVCATDLDLGLPQSLLNLNPNGWQGPTTWRMVYGMDVNNDRNLILAGDDVGDLHFLDTRQKTPVRRPLRIHKSGTKVVSIHCNPVDPDLFISAGNDRLASVWDMRALGADAAEPLVALPHPRVVNSAYFSPATGRKILTTCQDNRLRTWDYLYGDLSEPSREIVHSHDFNRYLTGFRAEWDPKDASESLVVVGRYISDDYEGVALHPIDFFDVGTGQLVAEVHDHNLTTICPVNKLHPRRDAMATGSSRSLFLWKPLTEEEEEEEKEAVALTVARRLAREIQICNADPGDLGGKKGQAKKRGTNGGGCGDDDDDDDGDGGGCDRKQTASKKGKVSSAKTVTVEMSKKKGGKR